MVLCCCLLVVAALPCAAQAQAQPATPLTPGVLDLSRWSPDQSEASLEGLWLVDWNRLDGAAAHTPSANAVPTPLPALWNGLPQAMAAGITTGIGAATYHLRVQLPPGHADLALRIPQIKSAMRVWINGRDAGSAGQPGLTEAVEVPGIITRFVTIPAGTDQIHIAIEMSNHFHFEGGMASAPTLALSAPSAWNWQVRLLTNAGVILALIMLAAYVAAFSRRVPAGLFLVFLLLVVSLRMSSTSEVLTTIFPDIPAVFGYRMEYLAIYLFWPIFFHLMDALFPGYQHRMVGRAMVLLGLSGCLLVLLTPAMIFTRTRDIATLLLAVSALYFAWGLARAALDRRPDALLLSAGVLTFSATVVHDGLMYAHLIDGVDLVPFGVLVQMYCQGLVLGRRVLGALTDVEILSRQLAELNKGLERQVFERTRESLDAQTQLREAKNQAEQDAKVKTRFLSDLSHEIRTPLNALTGLTWIMIQDETDPATPRAARLQTMHRAISYLSRLVEDVMELSPLGRTVVVREPVAPRELLALTADMLAPLAAQHQTALTLTAHPALAATYLSDPLRLRQILVNLCGLGLKYCLNGRVTLTVSDSGSGLRIDLHDGGPPIPKTLWGPVNEGFWAADDAIGRAGCGLRLAIVLRLTRALDGHLWVGTHPDHGPTFTVHLPADVAPLPHQRPTLSLPSLSPLHILLVEDAPESQVVMAHHLSGHWLNTIATGEAALKSVEQNHFDLILMDMHLGGELNGPATIQAIRALTDESRALTPIIALTASTSPEDHRILYQAGADEILVKPVAADVLQDALARHAPNRGTSPPSAIPPASGPARTLFLDACRQVASQLAAANPDDRTHIAALAHRIRGSAATFGYPDVADLAERVEQGTCSGGAGLENNPAMLADLIAALQRIGQEKQ